VTQVSVIVNYCSLEREFLPKVLAECAHFASEIVVSVGTHLYNGTPEDPEHLEALRAQHTGVRFAQYQVDAHIDLAGSSTSTGGYIDFTVAGTGYKGRMVYRHVRMDMR
jgi:hypothetical protein